MFWYIARESGDAALARNFVQKLENKCQELARSSFQLGRTRPEILDLLRSYAFGNYVIFFRYSGDTLEIVNILERHRDIEAFFESE